MAHKIAIISDTHNLLRNEAIRILAGCETILHAGDVGDAHILDTLSGIAPTYAVLGNTDKTLTGLLPETRSLCLFGIRIFMIHNKKMLRTPTENYDLILFGHSHKYEEYKNGSQTFFNPGSCGPRRFSLPVTMAILHTDHTGSFSIEKITLCTDEVTDFENLSMQDMSKIISSVIKDIQKGRSVDEICHRNKLSKPLAEHLCRLYLTHPGIDADGVLNKL